MSRRTAREHVFKMIFQTEFFEKDGISEPIGIYMESIEDANEDDMKFIESEVNGIIEKKDEVDKIIGANTEGWEINRIAKVDLAILRLAVYEILYSDSVPDKVAVNEAVELAKSFSSDKAPSFINAVLGKVISAIKK